MMGSNALPFMSHEYNLLLLRQKRATGSSLNLRCGRKPKHKWNLLRILILSLLCCFMMSAPAVTVYASQGVPAVKSEEQLEVEAKEHYQTKSDRLKEIYLNAMDDIAENPESILNGMNAGEWLYYQLYACYSFISVMAPIVGFLSVLLGGMICFMSRRNKTMLKRVFLTMVVGVPLLLILFVFGVGCFI